MNLSEKRKFTEATVQAEDAENLIVEGRRCGSKYARSCPTASVTAWQVAALSSWQHVEAPTQDGMPLKWCMPAEAFSRDLVIALRSPDASRLHYIHHAIAQVRFQTNCLCIITTVTVLVAACKNHIAGQNLTCRVPISIGLEWS